MPMHFVNFTAWVVEANNEDQALIKTRHFLKQGSPCIIDVRKVSAEYVKEKELCEKIDFERGEYEEAKRRLT